MSLLLAMIKFLFQEFTEDNFEANIIPAIEKFKPSCLCLYSNHVVRLSEIDQLPDLSARGRIHPIA